MKSHNPVGLIYWGTKGGGNRFALNAALELESNKIPVVLSISLRNENIKTYQELFKGKLLAIDLKITLNSFLFGYLKRRKSISEVFQKFKELQIENVVCVMPHLYDLSVNKIASQYGISVTRIIHDYKRHPGDFWPNRLSIGMRIIKSSRVIFLSDYVKQHAFPQKKNQFLTSFPKEFINLSIDECNSASVTSDVLVIGRIRKYKGHRKLNTLVDSMNQQSKVRFKLSGSGKNPINQNNNIEVKLGWMSESEFELDILQSKIVLLLHEEASQSGIPPIANKLGKWVVAPSLGGLKEQITEGITGYFYDPSNNESLRVALETAIANYGSLKVSPFETKYNFSIDLIKLLELEGI